mgnify:CR=1 FL=1
MSRVFCLANRHYASLIPKPLRVCLQELVKSLVRVGDEADLLDGFNGEGQGGHGVFIVRQDQCGLGVVEQFLRFLFSCFLIWEISVVQIKID